jgi:hypothetical protein
MADLSISQVREKFPQYSDLSDEQLAQGLHKKYYRDMPFDAFSQKIGLKSKQETPYMAPAELKEQRKGYRARLAGVGEVTPETKGFEKPALEGGLGRQLAGAAEGFVAGIPGAPGAIGQALNIPGLRALPSGPQIAKPIRKLFGEISPAEASGMETGAMFSPLKVPSAVIGTGRAAKTIGSAAKETGEGLFPASAIEKRVGPATTPSEIGKEIDKTIGGQLEKYIKARRPEAEKVFNNYLNKGEKVENEILNDYKNKLASYWQENAKNMTDQERAFVKSAYDRLSERPASLTGEVPRTGFETGSVKAGTVRPGIKAIEGERRFIGNIESGMIREGYEALPTERVSAVKKMLEDSIRTHVKEDFDAAKEVYKQLSAPINLYNTRLGKTVVQKADDFLPEIAKADPKTLPSQFFTSQRSAQELKTLTGDAKLSEQFARRHVANELEGKKTADQLRAYARDNRDWLQEFPSLQADIEKLAGSVKSGERVKNLGKLLAGGGAVGKIFGLY